MPCFSSSVIGALRLLDRTGREPQIDRAAGLVAQPVALGSGARRRPSGCSRTRSAGSTASSSTKAGSNDGEPVLRHADQRLRDRLMRAALRRQRDAGRRRHHDEAGVLVAGIVQRIEAARDEGIVERADRQQPLAVDRMRQPERRQQDEQVHLGDAELDMLALRREFPGEGRGDALVLEGVGRGRRGRTGRAGSPRRRDWSRPSRPARW